MYFFSSNLGDNLNYYLLKDMIDGNIKFYDRALPKTSDIFWDQNNIKKLNDVAKIDLFFIGSILDTICNWSYIFHNPNNKYKSTISKWYFKIVDYFFPLIIFGTGFISPQKRLKESYIRNLKIIALRGNITLQRLKRNGVKLPKNVVLADPGILAPMLINITNISELNYTKKYNLCIIPHYVDKKKNKTIKRRIHVNNSIILNIEQNPINFLESILQCKNVISSGLHGLIISDSLGIPNMRMRLSNRILGGSYKFGDYYSAYGLKSPPKINLLRSIFKEKHLKYLRSNYAISKDKIRKKQCELLSNFPFKLKKKYEIIRNIICK